MGGESSVRRTSVKLREVSPARHHGVDHSCAAVRPVGVEVQEDTVGHGTEVSNGSAVAPEIASGRRPDQPKTIVSGSIGLIVFTLLPISCSATCFRRMVSA